MGMATELSMAYMAGPEHGGEKPMPRVGSASGGWESSAGG